MMLEAQIGNRRRMIFTALAIVALASCMVAGYQTACSAAYDRVPGSYGGVANFELTFLQVEYLVRCAMIALLPLGLLLVSGANSPKHLRDPHLMASGVLILASVVMSGWLGHEDAMTCMNTEDPVARMGNSRERHACSWVWLLSPFAVTTAYVSDGAWRRLNGIAGSDRASAPLP